MTITIKTPFTAAILASICSVSACASEADEAIDQEPAAISEFTLDDLARLPYEEVAPGALVHEGEDITVEVDRGVEGAIRYLEELAASLEDVEQLDTPTARAEAIELRAEINRIEALLASDSWQVDAPRAIVSSTFCGIHYNIDYKFIPWFYRFTLETTGTVLANGVGPRPPYAVAGQIKAKSVINYDDPPKRIWDLQLKDFADTWLQSHSVTASAQSQLHSSSEWLTWKAVVVLTPSNPGCTGFQRIRVTGLSSYASQPIVLNTAID